jgi:hypothetical protein
MHTSSPITSSACATPIDRVDEPRPVGRTNVRRALTRQYKEAPPPMGVYAIRNLVEDRLYVGASNNVEGAINRARFELKMNGHRNRGLQQDWQRLGAEAFHCEVVDTVKMRDDPAFDAQAELADMLTLWREELGCRGARDYETSTALPHEEGAR